MDDGSPTLEVGFTIDTGGSFEELKRLVAFMDTAEFAAIKSAKEIERATGGMVRVNTAPATRELAALARETAKAEKSGEGMVRQMQRQVETFGKTTSEIRNMRAELRAVAAEEKGLTELAGRIRGLNSELVRLEGASGAASRGIGAVHGSGKLARHDMLNLAYNFQDLGVQMVAAAGSSAPLKMGLMALMQQGSQISGVMMSAGVGIRAVGAAFLSMSKSILIATATNPYLLAGAAAIGVFAGAVKYLQSVANDQVDMKAYAQGLGVTAKEMRQLDNVTVTFGDTAKAVFQVAGRAIWGEIGPAVTSVWDAMKEWSAWIMSGGKAAVNFLIGYHVGAYNVIAKTWENFPAVLGDVFLSGVNAAIGAINVLVKKTIDAINAVSARANTILPEKMQIPALDAPTIERVNNQYAGAFKRFGSTARSEMKKAMGADYLGNFGKSVGGAVVDQAVKNAQARLRGQAEEKGYLDPEKGKTDRRGEQLARDAAAIEAQIRNLYALADAYKVSGAAALIAEARVKAESEAIKKRGDIEAMVSREIRLSIAQRVSDAAKSTATLRDQAAAQEAVNMLVLAGLAPAERAAELVKDRITDLPLLAAIEAAQQRGLADEAARATAALADQRAERERLRKAEEGQRFQADMASGANRLAELREELRLVGATNAERNITLATLKATQEAQKFDDAGNRAAYVAQQIEIAMATERAAAATRDWNDALTFTADKWDIIAANVQVAGQDMADAFGKAGQAIGDIASIYADYRAQHERAAVAHKAALDAQTSEAGKQREIAKFNLASANAQIGMYGDMASAAKGFFSEKSKGYKALQAVEKAYRLFQFAMSVQQMARDMAETVSSVANSAVRATAKGAEGVAAQSKLPFPFNLAAMAATAAALVAAGIAVLGGGGGGASAPSVPNAEDMQKAQGTGTVFGDANAKSESIKRAIEIVAENSDKDLDFANDMLKALKSIEAGIERMSGNVARQIQVAGSMFDTSKLKLGSSGSGGILGIGASSTTRSLWDLGLDIKGSSVADILNRGIDGRTYQVVQQIKKSSGFLGIGGGTSTKYQTTTGAIDADIQKSIVEVVSSLRTGIVSAADILGVQGAQALLDNFQVNLGKISLANLSGEEIEEQLTAIFSKVGDEMAVAAFPAIKQFQRVGEGAFETMARVASTLNAVTSTLDLLGASAQNLSLEARIGLADQFESVSDLRSAADAYFSTFYNREEQAAARTAQMSRAFAGLNLAMPTTLAGFRQLVEAQNLTTASGRETYAVLLQLAPAFADLQSAMDGARSAAEIASERQDLQRQMLEAQGDTAALRALQLAKLDASNRELQQQLWAIQDAQKAAQAADELRKAWKSVGDSIMDEVRRIRGLSDTAGANGFAALQGRFNAATTAARGGDQDAAKLLPQLSQAMLTAAAEVATSRQELDRVRAQTAASLEATYGLISSLAGTANPASTSSLLAAGAASQASNGSNGTGTTNALATQLEELRAELAAMRTDNNAGHAANAGANAKTAQILERVTTPSGGEAIMVASAA